MLLLRAVNEVAAGRVEGRSGEEGLKRRGGGVKEAR